MLWFKFNGEMVEEMKKCVVAWMLNIVSSARISPQFHSIFPLKTSLLVLWQSRNLVDFVFGVGVGFCCKIVGTFVLLSNWTCRNVWWVIWGQKVVQVNCVGQLNWHPWPRRRQRWVMRQNDHKLFKWGCGLVCIFSTCAHFLLNSKWL